MRKSLYLGVLAALAVAGCSSTSAPTVSMTAHPPHTNAAPPSKAPDKPEAFLKWSMDRYKALASFSASCEWTATYGGQPGPTEKRTISFVAPNLFRAETSFGPTYSMTSISDGKTVVEYSQGTDKRGMQYSAPSTIDASSTMFTQHPMFCGTLLYKFFGGSEALDKLVDTSKKPVSFGKAETLPDGTKARSVDFYATGTYGNVTALIDEKDGTVRRISYDSESLLARMKDMVAANPKMKASGPMPTVSKTIEAYSSIKLDPDIAPKTFVAQAPVDISLTDQGGSVEEKPPVPIGSQMPDFQVQALDGKSTIKLSSLKGKVVMVDFWATWCGPCKMSLPHNEKLYKEFKDKGLQVMAVSDEDASTITGFLKDNPYTMPMFRDVDRKASDEFKIDAIPTMFIIDREGKLAAYFLGYHEESEVRAALKKVGIS